VLRLLERRERQPERWILATAAKVQRSNADAAVRENLLLAVRHLMAVFLLPYADEIIDRQLLVLCAAKSGQMSRWFSGRAL